MIGKIIRSYKDEGRRATLRKIWEHLQGGRNPQPAGKIDLNRIPIMPQLEDIAKADYLNHPYQRPAKLDKNHLNIAWVSPPVGKGGGGHTTISRFVKHLQSKGHQITFYIYHNNTIEQSAKEAQEIFSKAYGIEVAVENLEDFANQDLVFATSWETAYAVFNLKGDHLHKFYFVQDFEPIFYGVGSRYKLAEATYKFGFYGVTAGKWLTHKLKDYHMDADYFNFGADTDIYKPKAPLQKKKKIAFYARAHTERRGFELGVMALKIFKDKHPEYDIEFFGQDMSHYDIPFDFIDRGILNKEELATIYHDSVACLVLSLTNVSLLPLELLVAGCIPVMNSGNNNTMVLGENDDIAYAEAYPIALAEELCKAVERSDIDAYANEMSQKYDGVSWEDSYRKVEEIIRREVLND
ncbi:UNVERIFIED_CONTAM: glycosyltransferase family 1 protein [Streptococcus canis]|uniref:Glycosyltransferase family 1 protein n=1 Tax=Streptococcus canis TaxID=1329 RepID=A0AAE4TPV8_STRCB|nr:glycosyltransferase family 1 protein [Streptococcus canis]MDV5977355.1 glycosyltransferase family 1 protein [Streptococcus canis]